MPRLVARKLSPVNRLDVPSPPLSPRDPARSPRMGLRRTKGARKIQIPPCGTLVSTRSLLSKQHNSLAQLACQSIRHMQMARQASGTSNHSTATESQRWEGNGDLQGSTVDLVPTNHQDCLPVEQKSYDSSPTTTRYRLGPPPLNRMETLGMDEWSLEVLCLHVSELLGGTPTISALSPPRPPSPHESFVSQANLEKIAHTGNSSASLEFIPDHHGRQLSCDLRKNDEDQQIQEMKRIQQSFLEEVHDQSCWTPRHHDWRLDSASDAATATPSMSSAVSLISSRPSSQDHLKSQLEESDDQRRLEQCMAESVEAFLASNTTQSTSGDDLIEVDPGIFLPLHGSWKTFEALRAGTFVITKCFGCMDDLMVAPTVDLVICGDCWIFSPVMRHEPDGSESIEDAPPMSVGMGVKGDEMKRWLENEATTAAASQHQHD